MSRIHVPLIKYTLTPAMLFSSLSAKKDATHYLFAGGGFIDGKYESFFAAPSDFLLELWRETLGKAGAGDITSFDIASKLNVEPDDAPRRIYACYMDGIGKRQLGVISPLELHALYEQVLAGGEPVVPLGEFSDETLAYAHRFSLDSYNSGE